MGYMPLAACNPEFWKYGAKSYAARKSMSKLLDTIEGEPVTLGDDGIIRYRAKCAVDGDGTGPSHGDPDFQNQTSLKFNGQFLNADQVKYTVLPPQIIKDVVPVVLGCQGFVTNTKNGFKTAVVVADVGPRRKLGENSIATCAALGVNPSPTTGGEDAHDFLYEIHPGVPALVDGVQYQLQPF